MTPVLGGSLDGYVPYLPQRMNMYAQVFDDTAEDAVALIDLRGGRRDVSFGALRAMSDRVAAGLLAAGVASGDRVGVLFGQDAWCAASHLGAWKIGAVSVPLFKLFQRDALETRVADAAPAMILTDTPEKVPGRVRAVHPESFADGPAPIADTGPETPAVLIYTSGTTGKPKGALHGHRVLAGHLPGVEMSHDFLGQPGDVLWTPADWAWIGGLFDVLMPGLALGVPVVIGRQAKFSCENFVATVEESGARNLFLPPTALRMLKAGDARVSGLRSVASGGEPLGAEMLAWGRDALGVTINEFYGQTECNMVASSCGAAFPGVPGSIGRAAPGCDLAVIDGAGRATAGEGDIAVRRGAASMMLGYWNRPEATAAKFRGDWMLTGDRGVLEGGVLRFVGREDDVITSAGYRIGPAEIEDCLLTHPAVATCGVVGKPDDLRTEIVKAYIVLKPEAEATGEDMQGWVRDRLAAHCYPREVAFVDALPMTVTGKVIRRELKARAAAEVAA
ncbi:AMP-binding protein [Pseudaestuariivita atlantica]|uniref:AMP-dependent synthetase n=1 Tax=Pseudaestuariivita atlantica TaxID=1317121 RepID=A0A0L1JQD7_9RHOB|nr:AMP-binding protein [Pseudaestuariivita atlantica]KNG93956.1 AMP-dependent synthetase [Pseudaestuariivita atlantica]